MQQVNSQIHLHYFKQGDDLQSCLVTNKDGKVDVKSSIMAHIDLLKASIKQLKGILEVLPDDGDFSLEADGHYIGLSGPENIINQLVEKELVSVDKDVPESDKDEESSSSSSDSDVSNKDEPESDKDEPESEKDEESSSEDDPFDPNNVKEEEE